MTKQEDIRWEQRFSNYVRAFEKLNQAVKKIKNEFEIDEDGNINDDQFLDDIIKEGLIQRFEYTHELAWNVMRDYALYQGNSTIAGSRDASREAFTMELITEGKVWMDMIISRNKTWHTYNEAVADEIFNKIVYEYHAQFEAFKDKMESLRSGKQGSIFEKE